MSSIIHLTLNSALQRTQLLQQFETVNIKSKQLNFTKSPASKITLRFITD